MAGSNDHEDTTSRSTLLQQAPKMAASRYTRQTTRSRYIRLNLFVIAFNVLLILLGGAVMGLMAYTLAWSTGDSTSGRTYNLKPEVLEQGFEPELNTIRARPNKFELLGTQLVLVNGIITLLASLATVILLAGWPLRAAKRGLPTPNPKSSRFSLLIFISLVATIFTLAILITSWREYNSNETILFATFTTENGIYSPRQNPPSPEFWLRTLSNSIEGEADEKLLGSRALVATVGRTSLACMVSVQFIVLVGLLMLRERMRAGFVNYVKADEVVGVKEIELEKGDSVASTLMMPDDAERAGLGESMPEMPVTGGDAPAWMSLTTAPGTNVQTRYDPGH